MTTPTIESLIAKKKYSYVNTLITSENYPAPKTIQTKGWKLIEMGKDFSSEEAIARIKKEGLRAANIHELAQFVIDHPEELPDGKFTSIIAFGSTRVHSDGYHRVPYVYRHSDGDFKFDLGFFEVVWDSVHCLLAFCDETLETKTLSTDESSDSLTLSRAIEICKENGLTVTKIY